MEKVKIEIENDNLLTFKEEFYKKYGYTKECWGRKNMDLLNENNGKKSEKTTSQKIILLSIIILVFLLIITIALILLLPKMNNFQWV